ncbi:hypothetical protein SAMN05216323_10759 [Williamwhitmania taraxaci]|uniref:Uncharacterized protein n=1 Tax=Williamwhitmania taraxaci TaxID=1640674 RepID=A0A1G6RIA9_9BACT|nr:hypothetical protein SAMN05216323_10759 [Williamwhitmania taraxaci]
MLGAICTLKCENVILYSRNSSRTLPRFSTNGIFLLFATVRRVDGFIANSKNK